MSEFGYPTGSLVSMSSRSFECALLYCPNCDLYIHADPVTNNATARCDLCHARCQILEHHWHLSPPT